MFLDRSSVARQARVADLCSNSALAGLGWSFPCDMFSVGTILIECFIGKALFVPTTDLEHLAMMTNVGGEMPVGFQQRAA